MTLSRSIHFVYPYTAAGFRDTPCGFKLTPDDALATTWWSIYPDRTTCATCTLHLLKEGAFR